MVTPFTSQNSNSNHFLVSRKASMWQRHQKCIYNIQWELSKNIFQKTISKLLSIFCQFFMLWLNFFISSGLIQMSILEFRYFVRFFPSSHAIVGNHYKALSSKIRAFLLNCKWFKSFKYNLKKIDSTCFSIVT